MRALPAVAERFNSRIWDKTEGLPDNWVTAVMSDKQGFLWVGTRNGLARFDGVKFETLPFSSVTNASPRITGICEDAQDQIWIATQHEGLFYCTNNLLGQRAVKICAMSGITSLAAGTNNELWIGTSNGLFSFKAGMLTLVSQRNESIPRVCVANSGRVWVTTSFGVYYVSGNALKSYPITTENQSGGPKFLGVYEDGHHDLWGFGETYLINLLDGKRFNYFPGDALSSVRLLSFYEASDGALWAGTSGRGLFRFAGAGFRPVEIPGPAAPNDIRCICEDREGNMWLGTDGGGLLQLLPEHVREFDVADGLPNYPASCLFQWPGNPLQVAFSDGDIYSGNGERFELDRQLGAFDAPALMRSICAAPNGDIWVAAYGLGLTCYHLQRRVEINSSAGLFENLLTYACTYTNGDVWAGTQAGRVYLWRGGELELAGQVDAGVTCLLASGTNELWIGTESGSIWQFAHERWVRLSEPRLCDFRAIQCLYHDSRGWLWAGIRGGGLFCWYGAAGKYWPLSEASSDGTRISVYGIISDRQQDLWVTSSAGIAMIDKSELDQTPLAATEPVLRLVDRHDNNRTVNALGLTALSSDDGILWFLLAGKLVRVNPVTWERSSGPLQSYIQSLQVDRKRPQFITASDPRVPPKLPARLAAGTHALDFKFATPSFTAPEDVVIRYQLQGLDSDWVSPKPGVRDAVYDAVPPGDYSFQVMVRNYDGTWDPHVPSFAFTIPPPFWRSQWALRAYMLALAFGIYSTARLVSNRRLRKRLLQLQHDGEMARERMRIAQDMHDEIGSKLAKISFLTEGVKAELRDIYKDTGVIDTLSRASRELLQSLDQMVWAVNPRNDTLENLAAYLCQYSADFFHDTPVVCELDFPQKLPPVVLSAETRHNIFLAVKEALTNALKHSAATKVCVKLMMEKNVLKLLILDNGRGLDVQSQFAGPEIVTANSRYGISGIRRRLQSINGEFLIQSIPGQGTTYIFTIAIKGLSASNSINETQLDSSLHR